MEDEEKAKAKANKKKQKGKKKKAKKGKKEEEDPSKKIVKIGVPETVEKFDEFYQTWNGDWANRDESRNMAQMHDSLMTKETVMP